MCKILQYKRSCICDHWSNKVNIYLKTTSQSETISLSQKIIYYCKIAEIFSALNISKIFNTTYVFFMLLDLCEYVKRYK